MPALLVLSPDGQSFIHQCPHCHNERSELVNPSVNPYPFSYLPNCSSCGETLAIDTDTVHAIQQSYLSAFQLGAKKYPTPQGGRRVQEEEISNAPVHRNIGLLTEPARVLHGWRDPSC